MYCSQAFLLLSLVAAMAPPLFGLGAQGFCDKEGGFGGGVLLPVEGRNISQAWCTVRGNLTYLANATSTTGPHRPVLFELSSSTLAPGVFLSVLFPTREAHLLYPPLAVVVAFNTFELEARVALFDSLPPNSTVSIFGNTFRGITTRGYFTPFAKEPYMNAVGIYSYYFQNQTKPTVHFGSGSRFVLECNRMLVSNALPTYRLAAAVRSDCWIVLGDDVHVAFVHNNITTVTACQNNDCGASFYFDAGLFFAPNITSPGSFRLEHNVFHDCYSTSLVIALENRGPVVNLVRFAYNRADGYATALRMVQVWADGDGMFVHFLYNSWVARSGGCSVYITGSGQGVDVIGNYMESFNNAARYGFNWYLTANGTFRCNHNRLVRLGTTHVQGTTYIQLIVYDGHSEAYNNTLVLAPSQMRYIMFAVNDRYAYLCYNTFNGRLLWTNEELRNNSVFWGPQVMDSALCGPLTPMPVEPAGEAPVCAGPVFVTPTLTISHMTPSADATTSNTILAPRTLSIDVSLTPSKALGKSLSSLMSGSTITSSMTASSNRSYTVSLTASLGSSVTVIGSESSSLAVTTTVSLPDVVSASKSVSRTASLKRSNSVSYAGSALQVVSSSSISKATSSSNGSNTESRPKTRSSTLHSETRSSGYSTTLDHPRTISAPASRIVSGHYYTSTVPPNTSISKASNAALTTISGPTSLSRSVGRSESFTLSLTNIKTVSTLRDSTSSAVANISSSISNLTSSSTNSNKSSPITSSVRHLSFSTTETQTHILNPLFSKTQSLSTTTVNFSTSPPSTSETMTTNTTSTSKSTLPIITSTIPVLTAPPITVACPTAQVRAFSSQPAMHISSLSMAQLAPLLTITDKVVREGRLVVVITLTMPNVSFVPIVGSSFFEVEAPLLKMAPFVTDGVGRIGEHTSLPSLLGEGSVVLRCISGPLGEGTELDAGENSSLIRRYIMCQFPVVPNYVLEEKERIGLHVGTSATTQVCLESHWQAGYILIQADGSKSSTARSALISLAAASFLVVLFVFGDTTAIEMQMLIVLLSGHTMRCASEADAAAASIAQHFVSPFIALGPISVVLGNLFIILCVVILHVTVVKVLGRKESWRAEEGTEANIRGDVHVHDVAAKVFFPGASLLVAQMLYMGTAAACVELAAALVMGRASSHGGTATATLCCLIGLAYLVAVPAVSMWLVAKDKRAYFDTFDPKTGALTKRIYLQGDSSETTVGSPSCSQPAVSKGATKSALLNWFLPLGRWGPTRHVRTRLGLLGPAKPSFYLWPLAMPSVVSVLWSVLVVAGPLFMACESTYLACTIFCVIITVTHTILRPLQTRMQNILATLCQSSLAFFCVSQLLVAKDPSGDSHHKIKLVSLSLFIAMVIVRTLCLLIAKGAVWRAIQCEKVQSTELMHIVREVCRTQIAASSTLNSKRKLHSFVDIEETTEEENYSSSETERVVPQAVTEGMTAQTAHASYQERVRIYGHADDHQNESEMEFSVSQHPLSDVEPKEGGDEAELSYYIKFSEPPSQLACKVSVPPATILGDEEEVEEDESDNSESEKLNCEDDTMSPRQTSMDLSSDSSQFRNRYPFQEYFEALQMGAMEKDNQQTLNLRRDTNLRCKINSTG